MTNDEMMAAENNEAAHKTGIFTFKTLWNWGRLFLGIGGLLLVTAAVADNDALLDTFLSVNIGLVALSFIMVMLSTAVKTWRWMIVLNISGVTISFKRLFGTYMVGAFFSQFMPGSSMGGDAMRMVEMSADSGRAVDSVSSVLVERAVGITTVFCAASLILLISPNEKLSGVLVITLHLLAITAVSGLVILRMGWFVPTMVRLLQRMRLGKIGEKILKLSKALQGILGQGKIILQLVFLSFIANALTMTASYVSLLAFDERVAYLAFIPLIALAIAIELIPVSPGALGLREATYVTFLNGFLGVPEAVALGTALVVRGVGMVQAGLGGIILVVRAFSTQPQLTTPAMSGSVDSKRATDGI